MSTKEVPLLVGTVWCVCVCVCVCVCAWETGKDGRRERESTLVNTSKLTNDVLAYNHTLVAYNHTKSVHNQSSAYTSHIYNA